MNRLLEVIACSVEDAVEAEAGGAGRIELVRDLDRGGLTPPLALVRDVLAAVRIPVRAMLRETIPFEVEDAGDRARLLRGAHDFSSLGLDGLVLGFLKNGAVDLDLTGEVLACAPNLPATFHHAFEAAADARRAIEVLKTMPQIDRILTYGGAGDWTQRIARLEAYRRAAAPGITVLAGGGMDEAVLDRLTAGTALTEFHAGRAVRIPPESGGVVSRERVRELAAQLSQGKKKA